MKTQREDNHLQANEAGFRRHNPADALILNLSSKTGRWYMSAVQTPRSDCLVKAALTNDYRCWRTRARAKHVGLCFRWGVFRVPGPQESEHTVSPLNQYLLIYIPRMAWRHLKSRGWLLANTEWLTGPEHAECFGLGLEGFWHVSMWWPGVG